jgi:hypothetical protein
MKKALSIISAILIGIAVVGFLMIPNYYENRIKELSASNDTIVTKQREVFDFVIKANQKRDLHGILKDHLEILQFFYKDTNRLREKEEGILYADQYAVTHALSACRVTNKISKEHCDSVLAIITKYKISRTSKTYDQFRDSYFRKLYNKYIDMAAKSTNEIDEIRKNNLLQIDKLNSSKNTLWLSSFMLQSIGLALGVIVIGLKEKEKCLYTSNRSLLHKKHTGAA